MGGVETTQAGISGRTDEIPQDAETRCLLVISDDD